MVRNKRPPRQMRLAFTPLPSSSPAGARAIQELGMRDYASVDIKNGPKQKDKQKYSNTEMADAVEIDQALPTPKNSSQLHHHPSTGNRTLRINSPASGTPPRSSSTKQKKKRKRHQSRLDFSNHIGGKLEESDKENSDDEIQAIETRERNPPSQEEAEDDEEEDDMPRKPQFKRTLFATGIFGTQPSRPPDESHSSDESTEKNTSLKKLRRGTQQPSSQDESDDSGDDLFVRTLTRKGSPLARLRKDNAAPNPEEADQSDDDVIVVKKSSPLKRLSRGTKDVSIGHGTRRSSRHNPIPVSDDEDSDVEDAPNTRPGNSNLYPSGAQSESSGDDEPALYSSPAKKRKTSAVKKAKREDDFIVSDDEVELTVREEDCVMSDGETMGQKVSDDDREEIAAPVRRGRLVRRKSHQLTEREQEDLDEDLEFLHSSPPGSKAKTTAKKPDPRAEALAQLRRQRANRDKPTSSIVPPNDSDARERYSGGTSDEESEAEEESEPYNAGESAYSRAAIENEIDVDDFIDDDDDALGVPEQARLEMPLWATGFTTKKAKDLFRFAVEWMVQKRLNPGFNQNSEIYDITFRKLNDEVQGLAGSKFTSAAWCRDFTIALQARPTMTISALPETLQSDLDTDKCQACNRSGHPASFTIQFHGAPYDPDTLDEIDQDFDSDDESGSERIEYDHKSRAVPPAARTFEVGNVCADNAQNAHKLAHWKLSLRQKVNDQLEEEGQMEDRKILKRERMSQNKRRKYADNVVSEWAHNGQIKKLYKLFRDEVDEAKEREVSGWRARETFY